MSAYICTIRRRIFQLNQWGSESLIAAVASVIDNHSSFLRAQILQHPTDSEWDSSSSASEKVRDRSPLCGYCYSCGRCHDIVTTQHCHECDATVTTRHAMSRISTANNTITKQPPSTLSSFPESTCYQEDLNLLKKPESQQELFRLNLNLEVYN